MCEPVAICSLNQRHAHTFPPRVYARDWSARSAAVSQSQPVQVAWSSCVVLPAPLQRVVQTVWIWESSCDCTCFEGKEDTPIKPVVRSLCTSLHVFVVCKSVTQLSSQHFASCAAHSAHYGSACSRHLPNCTEVQSSAGALQNGVVIVEPSLKISKRSWVGKQWEAMGSNGKGSAGTAKLLLELLTLYLSNKATSDGILEAGKAWWDSNKDVFLLQRND